MKWLIVFAGSGIGGCLRLFVGELSKKWINSNFPWGTLIANFTACLLLGFVAGIAGNKWLDEKTRMFLVVGLCGGFSTFSTFSNETLELFSNQKWLEASVYIFISIISCIIAVYFGSSVLKWLN